MCRTRRCVTGLLSVLVFVNIVFASITSFTNGAGTNMWRTAGNWDTDISSLSDTAVIAKPGVNCTIDNSTIALASQVYVGLSSYGGDGQLQMTGGSLNIAAGGVLSIGYDKTGTFTMTAGDVNVVSYTQLGQASGGSGTLQIDCGKFSTDTLDIQYSTSGTCIVKLYGGTLTVTNSAASAFTMGTSGSLDIRGAGTLKWKGDHASVLDGYITGGRISTPSGSTVDAYYDASTDYTYVVRVIIHKYSNAGGNKLWYNGENWTDGSVPLFSPPSTLQTAIVVNPYYECIINSNTTASAYNLYVGLNSYGGTGYLQMTGGSLKVASFDIGYDTQGVFDMTAGDVNVIGETRFGDYYASDGYGMLEMTGGIFSTNSLMIPAMFGSIGGITLYGGTLKIRNSSNTAFLMRYYGGIGAIDIQGTGTLEWTGDHVSQLQSYINNGWIYSSNSNSPLSAPYYNARLNLTVLAGSYKITPEAYGAVGNGTTDDTDAFLAASQALTDASGGMLILTSGKTYRVGKQTHVSGQYPYYQYKNMIWTHDAYKRKVIIDGNNATLKLNDGLHFGSFDKSTGVVYNPTLPFTDYDYNVGVGNIIQIRNCDDVEIKDVTIDGNIDGIELGGLWGDQGRQCIGSGIDLYTNAKVNISNVYTHHNALDGIIVGWEGVVTGGATTPHVLDNIRSEYNARQGLSWVGGTSLTVSNSKFNHTGKHRFCSPPGAGLDIEAEAAVNRNGQFTNCDFVNNTSCGVVADSGDSADCNFTDCLIWGTTSWSTWIVKPGFKFTNCDIYGSAVHGYGSNDSNEATKYTNCYFSDYSGVYEGTTYDSYRNTALIYLYSGGENVTYQGCDIYANAVRAFHIGGYNKEIIKDCNIYHKYSGLANGEYQSVFVGSYLENVKFYESIPANNYSIRLWSVNVGPGVTVSGPRCKWVCPTGLTGTVPQGYLYQDNYESGNFNGGDETQGAWTTQNIDASVLTTSKYTGNYGAMLAKTTWIQKTISTAGYDTIHVKYNYNTTGMSGSEYLYVEWSTDGSNWNNLETTSATSWTAQDKTCGSGANNNANFRVRFRTNGSTTSKYAYIDDFIVTGTKL